MALERVKEYTELIREPPEFIEPRPASSWPENGAIKCENLIIRYAVSIFYRYSSAAAEDLSGKPELPNVLHNLNFDVNPGEKVVYSVHYFAKVSQSNFRSGFWGERDRERAHWHCHSSVS